MKTTEILNRIKSIRYASDVYPHDTEYIYECLSKTSNRTVKAAAIQTLRYLQDRYEGAAIILGHRLVEIDLETPPEESFHIYVLDIFGVKEKGTWVSGYISDGNIQKGQKLILEKADGRNIETTCIELNSPHSPHLERGTLIYMRVDNLTIGEISQGDVLRTA